MADLTLRPAYASLAEEDGLRFVGFVEADEEAYALFRQPVAGGPVWFELGDEDFGAEDALVSVTETDKGLEIALKPALAARFGWATSVAIRLGPRVAEADQARAALASMLGPLWHPLA